jgi:hypothetical protein
MSRVPGYPAAAARPGRSRASRSGRASSSPASRVAAGELAGQVGVVLVGQGTGPGQVVAAGPAAGGVAAAPDPRQPGLGDDLVDPGAVQRDAFAGQHRADLVDRVALRAQLDDPGAGGVLARRGLRAGPGVGEEVPGPATIGPEVAHRRVQARSGVAEALRDRGGGLAVQQVGPQRLVAALRARFRGCEVLPAGPGRLTGRHRGLRGIR